jgi:ABC-type Na+ efflux pump permease subunit
MPVMRIAAFHWRVLRRNAKLLVTHLLSLSILVLIAIMHVKGLGADEAVGVVTGVLLLAACAAPMGMGVHVLVSERVRGTMEAMLLLPVSKIALLSGKSLVVYAIALIEIAGVALVLGLAARAEGNEGLAAALASPLVWVVLLAMAPLLSALLTLMAVIISGRAEDAQTASNQSVVVALPIMILLGSLWFGALALRPTLVAVVLLVTVLLCGVALRSAAAWLDDETLASRRP